MFVQKCENFAVSNKERQNKKVLILPRVSQGVKSNVPIPRLFR